MFVEDAFGRTRIVLPDTPDYFPEPAKPSIRIYVNSVVEPNPGPGAFGVVLVYADNVRRLYRALDNVTNNAADIQAVIAGLNQLKKPCVVTVYTNNQYVSKCGSGDNVIGSNQAIWQQLFDAAASHEVHFMWVGKQSSDEWQLEARKIAEDAFRA